MIERSKRVNPRRSFQVTPAGLKRIVLGEIGSTTTAVPLRTETAAKPLRLATLPRAHLLVIAHSYRGALDGHAREAIAAAALLADASTAVDVLVLGALEEDLGSAGADRVHVAEFCDRTIFDPARELAVASELIERLDPRHILLPDNDFGDGDIGRRLAARLRKSVGGHLVELGPEGVAAYWQGRGYLARRDLPEILLLDPSTTDLALPFRGTADRIVLDAPVTANGPYSDLGAPSFDGSQLPLEEADFVVAAGNGVSDISSVEALAGVFGAAIGASRVAVDDGRFTRDRQVGATGKTVSASVYMAIGISGAVQHLQGIRAVRHVIAINTDASAPITRRADLTVVGDAQDVMAQLLEARRGRNWRPEA